MTIEAFESSTLHGFVGSPLYARNRVAPNTDAIARMMSVNRPVIPISSFGFTQISTTYPYQLTGSINTGYQQVHLGNLNAFKDIQPGWNRLTFFVWGVSPICNPWTQQRNDSFSDDLGRVFRSYNEAGEVSLQVSGGVDSGAFRTYESIPSFRQVAGSLFAGNPNRIPVNCVIPSLSSSFDRFDQLYRFQRTIKVSVLHSGLTAAPFFWVVSASSGALWPNLIGKRVRSDGLVLYEGVTQWLPNNLSGENPDNPILLNGQRTKLFDGMRPAESTGVAFVLRSVEQDSQYRPLEYTDSIFQAVS